MKPQSSPAALHGQAAAAWTEEAAALHAPSDKKRNLVPPATHTTIGPLLQLRGGGLEEEFWASSAGVARSFDWTALAFVFVNHALMLSTYGLPRLNLTNIIAVLPQLFFPAAGCLQLGILVLAPAWHQRHRWQLAAANRAARLLLLLYYASWLGRPDYKRLMLLQPRSSSGQGGGSSCDDDDNGRGLTVLFRLMVGPHVFILNHVNFLLPFKFSLFFQLATVPLVAQLSRRLGVCQVVEACVLQQHAQLLCSRLRKGVIVTTGLLLGHLPSSLAAALNEEVPGVCTSVAGTAMLQLQLIVLIIVVLPALLSFLLELQMKVGWCKRRGVGLASMMFAEHGLAQFMLVAAVVVVSWWVCEWLVPAAGPWSCSAASALVRG